MLFCRRKLTPLQQRSLQLTGSAMILTVVTNLSTPRLPNPLVDMFPALGRMASPSAHAPLSVASAVALIAVVPIVMVVWIAGRYLKAEPDEFIRALVMRALLWGFAVAMVGNAVAGVFMNIYGRTFPLTVLDADLFFVSGGIAFRLLQRSYR
jgi:hypothetical protein